MVREGGAERSEIHAISTRKDAIKAGYKNADDIAVGVQRRTRLNATYIVRLVVFGLQAILVKFPRFLNDVIIIHGVVYIGGGLLRLLTRWVTRRAHRARREKNKTYPKTIK